MENYSKEIPFGKAVRLGNFKLWRSKFVIGTGAEKTEISCVCVSNLDGSWMTRIPSTSNMYGVIVGSYNTADADMREKFLGMIIGNIYNVSLTPSEVLHDAFFFLQEMLRFPYLLLSEKEMKKRMEENLKKNGMEKEKRKEYINELLSQRNQLYEMIEKKRARVIEDYERQMEERRNMEQDAEKALDQDELADEAVEILQR